MRALTWLILPSALLIGACATTAPPPPPAEPAPAQGEYPPVGPSKFKADQLVGHWGLAAYHQDSARVRTEAAARSQCRNPYRIAKGPTGGVMMHLADAKELSEVHLRGGADGKDYIGPQGPISEADREIVSFDGRVMLMRWLDADAAKRYGTMVYVRCR